MIFMAGFKCQLLINEAKIYYLLGSWQCKVVVIGIFAYKLLIINTKYFF